MASGNSPKPKNDEPEDPTKRSKREDGLPVFFAGEKQEKTNSPPASSIPSLDRQNSSQGNRSTDNTASPAASSTSSDPNNSNPTVPMYDLTGQRIKLNNISGVILKKILCRNIELYAIGSDIPMKGCSNQCPRCDGYHIPSTNSQNGYYAEVNEIHKKFFDDNNANERAQGPKSTNELKKGPEKALPLTEPLSGRDRGIEGDANSCYMDSTIFCMFAYSGVFDNLLNKNVYDDRVRELQTILRENIVNVLRNRSQGFVGRDALYRLRVKLSEVTGDQSFREEEKDPTEFLRAFESLFNFAPLKTIPPNQPPNSNRSNITSNIMWEMFDPNISKQPSINIASIFRNSLTEIPARLATIPPFLILIAPRHSRTERSYRYIIPDRKIKVDHHMVQLVCEKCRNTNHDSKAANNFYHCYDCPPRSQLSSTEEFVVSRCYNCVDEKHEKEDIRNEHKLRQVKEIVTLNLFAVLCIERCHYVAFVKCQKSSNEHEWLFFDSMSDREGNTKNIPSVSRVPDFERWIKAAEKDDELFKDMDRRRSSGLALSRAFPGDDMKMLRLFRDGAFFFYENPTANYH